MAGSYYKPCKELDECNRLIEIYFKTGQYEKCFAGHLPLAKRGYPLAECQIGYFYLEGLGVKNDPEKAFLWTERSASHGDGDAQNNLGEFYLNGMFVEKDLEKAKEWFLKAALQGHEEARKQCEKLGVPVK